MRVVLADRAVGCTRRCRECATRFTRNASTRPWPHVKMWGWQETILDAARPSRSVPALCSALCSHARGALLAPAAVTMRGRARRRRPRRTPARTATARRAAMGRPRRTRTSRSRSDPWIPTRQRAPPWCSAHACLTMAFIVTSPTSITVARPTPRRSSSSTRRWSASRRRTTAARPSPIAPAR